jgi:cell wall-associated NlpC family hydrolase
MIGTSLKRQSGWGCSFCGLSTSFKIGDGFEQIKQQMKKSSNRPKLLPLAILGSLTLFPAFGTLGGTVSGGTAPRTLLTFIPEVAEGPIAQETSEPRELPLIDPNAEDPVDVAPQDWVDFEPQRVESASEDLKFEQLIQGARSKNLSRRPLSEIISVVAEQFIGTPYVAGLLDQSPEETLVISLAGFDCVLFIETVLAIARGISVQDYTYQGLEKRVEEQRYRDGKLTNYCSRLHYFSDWIYDNAKRGLVVNITPSLGGIPLNQTLNFMTEHRQSYPQLADDGNYDCIRQVEAKLKDVPLTYIPQDQISTLYDRLQPGDIIATATDIEGLDVTHTGLVFQSPDGKIGFIHASPSGQVTVSPDLQSYVQAVEGQIGIIVARPLDTRPQYPDTLPSF